MTNFVNRAYFGISNTPGTAGALTVSAAESGPFRTLGAAHDGLVFDVAITDGSAWEVRRGCTYTHGSTSLSRGTLEDSSTGSAIALTSSAKVMITATAQRDTLVERLMRAARPGGRLTLTSGTPVTTSDVTGATTIYYTPHVHDTVVLWDGASWVPTTFTETSHALGAVTSGANYDVFGFLSGDSLALEKLVWTNDTTRATAVTLQDGRYCKSGDKTRLYLGTFRTTSTTATEDSGGGTATQVGGKRFVWNMYNRVNRALRVIDTADSWSYTTDTIRQANGATGNKVEYVCGIAEDPVYAFVHGIAFLTGNTARAAKIGVGVDSTSSFSGTRQGGYVNTGSMYAPVQGAYRGIPGVGYHYLAWVERGADGTCVFLGDNGETAGQQAGLIAEAAA